MTDRKYLDTSRYSDQLMSADRRGLDPDVREFVRVFIRAMANVGVPCHAEDAYVSPAEQARRYVMGESSDRPGRSPFNSRRAFTLVHSVFGRKLPPLGWSVLGHVGLESAGKLGLVAEWGGQSAPWQWDCRRA